MEKHKDKALENECQCTKCIHRFSCFTQERVFSDPIYQGLFEALIAQGKTKEEALDEVAQELKYRIRPALPVLDQEPITSIPNTSPNTLPPYIIYTSGNTWEHNGGYIINYTMHNGEEVSWNANNGICIQGLGDTITDYRSGETEVHSTGYGK